MALFLLRFWPVLVPLLVYLWWMCRVRARAKKAGVPVPHFRAGPWFWALIASFLIAAVMLLVVGLGHESVKGVYVPPHVEDGKIVPGQVQP